MAWVSTTHPLSRQQAPVGGCGQGAAQVEPLPRYTPPSLPQLVPSIRMHEPSGRQQPPEVPVQEATRLAVSKSGASAPPCVPAMKLYNSCPSFRNAVEVPRHVSVSPTALGTQ